MPSGQSTAAFAGLIFLALYLNAQLKVMSAHNPAYWKMVLFFAPILGAVLIAGALTIDEFHNWNDVVAGGIIGSVTAYVAFRQTFAAVFDFRFNHLLLPRTSSIFHRTPFIASGSSGPFFTYRNGAGMGKEGGGWGEEAYVGAPFDASGLNNGFTGLSSGGYEGNNVGHRTGHGGNLGRAKAGVSQPHNGVAAPGTAAQQTHVYVYPKLQVRKKKTILQRLRLGSPTLVGTGHDRHVQGAEIIPRTRPKQLAAELLQFLKRIHQLPQHINLSEGIHNGQPQPPEALIPRLPNPLLDVHLQRHQRKARGGQELRERLPPAEDLLHGEQADADARGELAALGDDGSDGLAGIFSRILRMSMNPPEHITVKGIPDPDFKFQDLLFFKDGGC
ncbi:hypothetical protein EYR38_002027 [Pleurotus pulmonarius]|nr:hypothetical protein EYR38_002027 [Pleurotus pulmonarius]